MKVVKYKDLQGTYDFFSNKPDTFLFRFVMCFLVVVVSFILWSVFASLDDVVSAKATIRPLSNVSTIRSSCTGNVVYIGYKNGLSVTAGDILLSIDTTLPEKEIERIEKQISLIEDEEDSLDELQRGVEAGVFVELHEKTNTQFELKTYFSELGKMKKGLENAELRYNQELEKPAMFTNSQILQELKNEYERASFELESYTSSFQAQIMNKRRTLKANKELLQNELEKNLNTLKQSEIKAPVSGNVLSLREINTGDILFAGDDLLQIIPPEEEILKAELVVETSAFARVSDGNPVRIKLEGLSPFRFGYVDAMVSSIPPDYSVLDDGKTAFIVEARISKSYLESQNGEIVFLKPGLLGSAKIIIGHERAYVVFMRKFDFLW